LHILALQTSGRLASLAALSTDDQQVNLVDEVVLPEDQRTAQSLLPALRELLDQGGWKSGSIELVCAATGPGSFTGLRIGITVAKTWAYATGAALVGVHTLAALAGGTPRKYPRLWTILDAQRQALFTACFAAGGPTSNAARPETQIVGIDDWLAHLRPGDAVVGPPLKKLAPRLPAEVVALDAAYWEPRASVVGRLGYAAFQQGRCVEPMQLAPEYFRQSAAEEKAARTS